MVLAFKIFGKYGLIGYFVAILFYVIIMILMRKDMFMWAIHDTEEKIFGETIDEIKKRGEKVKFPKIIWTMKKQNGNERNSIKTKKE
jgi:hypothetical protein